VLIHGAASDSRDWLHLRPALEALSHEVVTPDLALRDDSTGLIEYADSVVEAVEDLRRLLLSLTRLRLHSATRACDRLDTKLLVMVNECCPPQEGLRPSGGERLLERALR
jgi:hypothetical protein